MSCVVSFLYVCEIAVLQCFGLQRQQLSNRILPVLYVSLLSQRKKNPWSSINVFNISLLHSLNLIQATDMLLPDIQYFETQMSTSCSLHTYFRKCIIDHQTWICQNPSRHCIHVQIIFPYYSSSAQYLIEFFHAYTLRKLTQIFFLLNRYFINTDYFRLFFFQVITIFCLDSILSYSLYFSFPLLLSSLSRSNFFLPDFLSSKVYDCIYLLQ